MEQMCAGRAGRVTGFTGKEREREREMVFIHRCSLFVASKHLVDSGNTLCCSAKVSIKSLKAAISMRCEILKFTISCFSLFSHLLTKAGHFLALMHHNTVPEMHISYETQRFICVFIILLPFEMLLFIRTTSNA